jgi:hypothetical protein
MSIRIALLGAALAAGWMSTAMAADSAATSFGSEAEFVAKFGAQAQKTGKGQYSLQRGGTNYTVNFGAAALRATLAEVESQLENLSHRSDGSAKATGDRARLQQRREELLQRLSTAGAKTDAEPPLEQCGFKVSLQSSAVPQIASGFATASATVTPSGTVPAGGWQATIELYATAGAADLSAPGGGLTARNTDYVGHVTYNNYTSPPRPAQAEIMAFYTCLRATSSAEVTAPSGNIWFPNYCGPPITVVAQYPGPGCPAYY